MNAKGFSDRVRMSALLVPLLFFGLSWPTLHGGDDKQVILSRTPGNGIQPQAVLDSRGNLHLLYFQGDPGGGDLYYVRRAAGRFSRPIRVNSQPGSAIAIGTIRGGQIALGKKDRVHVAWNGSGKSLPKGPGQGVPMLYARGRDDGEGFEPQRNLMRTSEVLDGGGTVAADQAGNVYVSWHGRKIGGIKGEENRQVWVAVSRDEGKSFAGEVPAFAEPTGACGCCGMRAFADRDGNAYLIYRAATGGNRRDMWLLSSADAGKSFQGNLIHKWSIDACPMSSETFAQGGKRVYVAWETRGQVYFGLIKPGSPAIGMPVPAPGDGRGRKHPALAVNSRGEVILVWTEGTGWQRGGDMAWQVFDAQGRPTSVRGRRSGAIPVWGLPTVIARPDGGFEIFY